MAKTPKKTPYWWRVMDKARTRVLRGNAAFTDDEIRKAEDWVTCACGKQDPRIPRGKRDPWASMEPDDLKLRNLGIRFSEMVDAGHIEGAEATLLKIEQRSAEILKGLKA